MKTIESPTMTQDEIDMLNGLRGQMSDGAGENMSWCNKYWPYMQGFENKNGKSYFMFENDGIFQDKTDANVIKAVGRAFSKICVSLNEIPDCGPELFYHDDERRNKSGHTCARSIVKKLTGKDTYHTPTLEDIDLRNRMFYGNTGFGMFGF